MYLHQKVQGQSFNEFVQKYADSTSKDHQSIVPYYLATGKSLPASLTKIRKLNDTTAIVKIEDQATYNQLNKDVAFIPANNNWKLSPSLENRAGRKNNSRYIVTGNDVDQLKSILSNQFKSIEILSVNIPSRSIIVRSSRADIIKELLSNPHIIFIDIQEKPTTETGIIGYDRSFHGISAVDYLIPEANGKNIVAGIKEQMIDERDLDIWKRVLPSTIKAPTISLHATVIASIIGGAGNSFYDGRGIAWGCQFFPSSFGNLFADDQAILTNNKVTVQNHSYGTIIQQFYGAEAVSYDQLCWNNKNYIPVFSSGNQGENAASEGRYQNLTGFANLTGNFKMAKNVLTIGAVDNKDNIAAQSSAGPLYDGRLAPQLIALGPNGTSDAAAIVSGTIAVMQQVYADSNNNTIPPASLIKSVLYNTTDDVSSAGIDYKTGYGLLHSYAAIRSIQQKKYDGAVLTNGEQWTKEISVPANAGALKITLSWTDSISGVNNNKALINDLDLEVKEINTGNLFLPWVLSTAPHIDSLKKLPRRGRDSLNTSEQVSIQLPAPGNYQIYVKGTALVSPIYFNVAHNIDTLNTFMFTSPVHTSDVNRFENEFLNIRWITFVADTNQTGNIFISYNSGITWQLISQVKLHSKKYSWQIKDTSSVALLKMETAFGNFLSNRFVITKLTKLQVDFNCTDSFRLSWNKHIYATSYKVFALTDSPYLKNILNVTDTFIVLQRATNPSMVYAVEPVLSNGVPAARSVAIEISLQGVSCFYTALNYNLLDKNTLNLILELSAPSYVDSVSFEMVTSSGQLIKVIGSAKTNDFNAIYSQFVNELTSGTVYLRARIILKNGSQVYTNIISVQTSGDKNIVFYPNPASKNVPLTYVLLQGISTSSKLQLYNVDGKLLKSFTEMPGRINISSFPTGVIIYKLLSVDNVVMETGKIIIQ